MYEYSVLLLVVSMASASTNRQVKNNNMFARGRHQELPGESNAPVNVEPTFPTACMVDGMGDFGSNKGHIVTVDYLYEVETVFSVGAYSLNNYILDDVEKAASSILLPTLFTEQCGISSEARQHHQRQSVVHGISTFPPDRISEEVLSCIGSLEKDGDKCFVVKGITTVFVEDGTNGSEIRDLAAGEIKLAMDSGAFDGVHRDVVKISFRGAVRSQPPPTPVGSEGRPATAGSTKPDLFAVWVAGGIIVGFAVLFFTYKLLSRKEQRRREELQCTEDGENATLVYNDNSTLDLEREQTPSRPPSKTNNESRSSKEKLPKKPLSVIDEEGEEEVDVQVDTAVLA